MFMEPLINSLFEYYNNLDLFQFIFFKDYDYVYTLITGQISMILHKYSFKKNITCKTIIQMLKYHILFF